MNRRKIDESRPFARLMTMNQDPDAPVAEQDGRLFNRKGEQVGKTDGFDRLQKKRKAKAAAAVADAQDATDRAEAILGGLEPGGDVRKENAAAAEAEKLSDDA